MKAIKIVFLVAILSCMFSKVTRGQLPPSSHKKLLEVVNNSSVVLIPNAQIFVEKLYQSSSVFYNDLKPSVKSGDFLVLVVIDSVENKLITTKDLQNVKRDQIVEFTFHKSPLYDALYGEFARNFGMVTIKMKD